MTTARRPATSAGLCWALLLCATLLQRIQVPGAGVPLLLPLMVGLGGWGVRRHLLRWDRARGEAIALALAAVALTGLVGHLRHPTTSSVTSMVYLLVLYVPLALAPVAPVSGADHARVVDRFTSLLTVLGGVAILQLAVQLAGGPFLDPVTSFVPSVLRVPGYLTTYETSYGSGTFKSNGTVFLEASFCSQFLGLGALLLIARGQAGWRLAVILLGLVCTTAGTGVILLAVGLVALALGRRPALLRVLAGPAVVGLAALTLSPVGQTSLSRATEITSSNSSASLRFVAPFQLLGSLWTHSVDTVLTGLGPGASERAIRALVGTAAVQAPAPLKLLVDYGGLAGVTFLVCVGWCVVRHSRLPAVTVALVVAWLILSSALLQPLSVVLLWVFGSLLAGAPGGRAVGFGPSDRDVLTESENFARM